MPQWYRCEPITDCASDSFSQCRTLEDDRVVFFDAGDSWIILTKERAKLHFKIVAKLDEVFCVDLENGYQCALNRNQSATSSGGSKNDTPSTCEDYPEPQSPGQPV